MIDYYEDYGRNKLKSKYINYYYEYYGDSEEDEDEVKEKAPIDKQWQLDFNENLRIFYNKSMKIYTFYCKNPNNGPCTLKIIFKKKLLSCNNMFKNIDNVIEIDLSNFDSSKIRSCKNMFYGCSSVKKITFGKLFFSYESEKDFSKFFCNCENLVDLDISNLNTKNAISFKSMFGGCSNLKNIDVSKFDSSKCKSIYGMFSGCNNIKEIDMINWNMSNLQYDKESPIDYLFSYCEKLKKIKISGNINKGVANKIHEGNYFQGLPENGDLITSKTVPCNIPLDGYLPQNWTRNKE